MLPHRPKHPPTATGTQDSDAEIATRATAGDKRKREDDAVQPGTIHKRQVYDLPFRDPVPSVSQFGNTDGQKFLSALFAIVSTNRMLRQRWELYIDSREKYKLRCRVVESFKAELEGLQRRRDLQPANQQQLNESLEYQNQLQKFVPEREESKTETSGLLREHDGLRGEVEASVESLLVYSKSLRSAQALQFLASDDTFWKAYETRQSTAEMATKNAKAALTAIEDERLAIRNRMEARSKQILISRLTSVGSLREDVNASATPAKTATGITTEQDLRRLSDLVLEERNLKYNEKFKDARTLRSQSEELLKLAERAFVDAKLLAPDNNVDNFQGGWYGKPKKREPGDDTGGNDTKSDSEMEQ